MKIWIAISSSIFFGLTVSLIFRAVLFQELASFFSNEGLIISTPQGELRGIILRSRDGFNYNSFKGIRYGKMPERFMAAQAPSSWTGVQDTTEFGNACPQYDLRRKIIIGNEDCLFLNVYSPINLEWNSQAPTEMIPVMVWFYPGAFEYGKSDDYDPRYFMDENVVLVTVNHRMGALGFLSTGDKIVPGNMGLKDQTLALQWIQSNIAAFGGDSGRVTLFGNSAGGASVHLHMLSPGSKGLFSSGISQSGSAFAPWVFQKQPQLVTKTLAEHLSCPTDSMSTIVDCIKMKTSHEIITAQLAMKTWGIFPINNFGPVIEPKETENSFLDDDPRNLAKEGRFTKVPWITGITIDEGALFSPPIILNENFTEALNDRWKQVIPNALLYNHIEPEQKRDELSEKILKFYFENQKISNQTWSNLTNLFGDRYFVAPFDEAVRLHSKYSSVYAYEFAFSGGESKSTEAYFAVKGKYGVAHTDELQYQFNCFYGSSYIDSTNQTSLEFSKKFIKLWTNFATNSAQFRSDWEPIPNDIGESPLRIYEISAETRSSSFSSDFNDRMAFWNELRQLGIDVLAKE